MHREREEQRLMPYFVTGACLVAYLALAVSAPSLHDWWHRHHAHEPDTLISNDRPLLCSQGLQLPALRHLCWVGATGCGVSELGIE